MFSHAGFRWSLIDASTAKYVYFFSVVQPEREHPHFDDIDSESKQTERRGLRHFSLVTL